MEKISKIIKFLCSPFRQEVELVQVDHAAGFRTLRLRIREGKRFTILDLDPTTAARLGGALSDWAEAQPSPERGPEGDISSVG